MTKQQAKGAETRKNQTRIGREIHSPLVTLLCFLFPFLCENRFVQVSVFVLLFVFF